MDNRKRIDRIKEILIKETDEDHVLTAKTIEKRLNDEGIKCDYKTIKKDLKYLEEDCGLDIICKRSVQNRYYLGEREFQTSEVKAMLDAIESSQFITKDKTKKLQDKLLSIFSDYERKKYEEQIKLVNKIKQKNEKIYYDIDIINTAILNKIAICFKYVTYNQYKEEVLKHNGRLYIVSPYLLIWNDDRYYLIAYSHVDKEIRFYRVDRIRNVDYYELMMFEELKEDLNKSINKNFNMFDGENIQIELICDNDKMDQIIDKFGFDVETEVLNEYQFKVKTKVKLSPTFYSWIFAFGGKIKLVGSKQALEGYKKLLNDSKI